MAQTPEGKVKKQITDYLDEMIAQGGPIYWERRNATGLGYKKGLPDIWMCYNGIHIEVEIKTEKGSRSAMQETWERYFVDHSISYILAHSLTEFKDKLLEIISA